MDNKNFKCSIVFILKIICYPSVEIKISLQTGRANEGSFQGVRVLYETNVLPTAPRGLLRSILYFYQGGSEVVKIMKLRLHFT